MVLWHQIGDIEGAKVVKSPDYGEVVFLPVPGLGNGEQTHWMISRYEDQTKLATALREDPAAQKFVAEHRVRFGFRKTDVPPINVDFQKGFGPTVVDPARAGKDHTAERINPVTKPANEENAKKTGRVTDEEENVRLFWRAQTPQSHHIVEYNNLRDIGRSKKGAEHFRPLDHSQLPCVLLAAEFHQRYVSTILRPIRGKNEQELRECLEQTYWSMYMAGGVPLRPLWAVSRLILREAGITIQ